MNTLLILLVQTKNGATIEILFLLLGAVVFGYVTAWFYYKSVYELRVEAVEADKNELINQIVNLDEEIFDLKRSLMKHISERKGRIYFNRLGVAHKYEANNLTLIDGLGLWVEERLNALGIYTFEQISRLTHKDIETITEVLEIIPGRIEKENWVGQAKELANKHLMLA